MCVCVRARACAFVFVRVFASLSVCVCVPCPGSSGIQWSIGAPRVIVTLKTDPVLGLITFSRTLAGDNALATH